MPVLRRLAVLLALLVLGGGLAAVPAGAQRATAPAAATTPADDDGSDAVDAPEGDLDQEDPGDDADATDADLCQLDVTQEDDVPAADEADATDDPVQDADPSSDDVADEDPDPSCDDEDTPELAKGATVRLARAALLRSGRVDAGHVRVARGAVVRSELLLGATGPKARPRVLGHLRVVARTTGELHLVVRLDRAARKLLRARTGARTLTVRTTVRPRHGAARVIRGTLRLTSGA